MQFLSEVYSRDPENCLGEWSQKGTLARENFAPRKNGFGRARPGLFASWRFVSGSFDRSSADLAGPEQADRESQPALSGLPNYSICALLQDEPLKGRPAPPA